MTDADPIMTNPEAVAEIASRYVVGVTVRIAGRA